MRDHGAGLGHDGAQFLAAQGIRGLLRGDTEQPQHERQRPLRQRPRARDARDLPRMARVAQAWDKVNRAAREVETYNLERKPLVFAVFGALAEAARG